MTTTTVLPPVTRSVTVAAPVDKAFRVFTEQFAAWWPPQHVTEGGYAGAFIEPRVGGRWYHTGTDGVDYPWGSVLAWEPPTRVVLSWHLNGEFAYDPDPARASEVEVTFTPDGDGTTVALTHRHFERAVAGKDLGDAVGRPGGWGVLVRRFADLVDGRPLTPLP